MGLGGDKGVSLFESLHGLQHLSNVNESGAVVAAALERCQDLRVLLQRKRVAGRHLSGRTVERVCISVAVAPRLRELALDCLTMIKSNCKPLCDGLSSPQCLIRTLKLERCLVAMALASPLGSALG